MPDDDDPYRTASHGHSATLERLAGRHPSAMEIDEAASLEMHDRVLAKLLGLPFPGMGRVNLAWTALIVGALLRWIGLIEVRLIWVTFPAVLAAYAERAFAVRRWRRRVAKRLAWIDQQPFPISGLNAFLLAMRPMIDITFRKPPTVAALAGGVQGYLPDAEVIAIDDRTLRIICPNHDFGDKFYIPSPLVTGFTDDAWLHRFVDEVVRPVHNELGVERVRLGGSQRPRMPPQLARAMAEDQTTAANAPGADAHL